MKLEDYVLVGINSIEFENWLTNDPKNANQLIENFIAKSEERIRKKYDVKYM